MSIQPSFLEIVTSDGRTIHCIKSKVSERASRDNRLPERPPGSTEASLSLCKAELQKTLDAFDVGDHRSHFGVLQILNYFRGLRSQAMSSWLVKTNKAHTSPQARCLSPQWCAISFFTITPPVECLFGTGYVSVLH